ncbi:hypothetical protein, partial [Desulfonatronospira sp.]|uniref:hypothetical protein n=1 Tax=Desulfonatronospira sp. TaxID=1962951 RepID=UPI0025BF3EAF
FGTGNFVAHPSETSYAETTFVSRDRRAALPLTVEEWCLSCRVSRLPGCLGSLFFSCSQAPAWGHRFFVAAATFFKKRLVPQELSSPRLEPGNER